MTDCYCEHCKYMFLPGFSRANTGVQNYHKFTEFPAEVYGLFFHYSYGKTSHKLPKNCAQCTIMLSSLNLVTDTSNFQGMITQNTENDSKILSTETSKLSLEAMHFGSVD